MRRRAEGFSDKTVAINNLAEVVLKAVVRPNRDSRNDCHAVEDRT
jgi:hypothetical protein